MTLDVFTLGEAMLRFSAPPGVGLDTAPHFKVDVAGAEANVAHALARLGRSVAWASRLPDSALGKRVLADLRGAGIDCSNVSLVSGARMGTYFVDVNAAPRPTGVIYDRADSAVCSFGIDDLDWDLIARARVVHLTGITPSLSESLREASEAVADAAGGSDTLLCFDVNYRHKLWSRDQAVHALTPIMERADIIVCGRDDALEVFGMDGDPWQVAARLATDFSARSVVVTGGADGAWWWDGGDVGFVEPMPVVVLDRLGAGDAFTAGVVDGLLDGDFVDGVSRGSALAAIALTTQGDQTSATREEMVAVMRGSVRDVDR